MTDNGNGERITDNDNGEIPRRQTLFSDTLFSKKENNDKDKKRRRRVLK